MTWIYSSFVWHVNWSAEPQTVAVPVLCGSACGSPRQASQTPGAVVITTQGLLLYPSPFPKSVLFSVSKVTKINLKVSFFVT